METTLTIPKNRIMPSLAVAGLGSLACAGSSHGMLTNLLEVGGRSSGSNVTWLESALPGYSPLQGENLYVLTIQRLKSLSAKTQDAKVARSDRDLLLEIKDVLSLTGIQMAKAMGVSRTALYQWIEESKTMRPKYRKRLEKLKSLSDLWSEKTDAPISRSPWVGGANRTRLAEMLAAQGANDLKEARQLLEQLSAMKPEAKQRPRSVLELIKEKNLKKLPEHIRHAELASRLPSARTSPEPS
jgi:DNA-binding XRE family transcriptional regulator